MSTTNTDPTIFCLVGAAVIFIVYLVSANKQLTRKSYYRRGTRHGGQHGSRNENSHSSSSAPEQAKANISATQAGSSQVKSWIPAPTLTEALERIDNFSGIEFEHYIAHLLRIQGYQAEVTPPSSDKGVDVIAQKEGRRFAVQVKRYDGKVSQDAVMQVIAGQSYYACDVAMVVTNSHFNQNAVEYAERTGCILVNRGALANWIRLYDVAHELLSPEAIIVDYVGDQYLPPGDPSVTTVTVGKLGQRYLVDKLCERLAEGDKVAILEPPSEYSSEIRTLKRMLVQALPQRRIVDLAGRELEWDTDATSWADVEQQSASADVVIRRDLSESLLSSVPAMKVVVVSRAEDFRGEELLKLRYMLAAQKGRKWLFLIVDEEPAKSVDIGCRPSPQQGSLDLYDPFVRW